MRKQLLLHQVHLISLSVILGVGSCNLPKERPTEAVDFKVPSTFVAASTGKNEQIASGWLKTLKSPQITSLVKQGLAQNPDLKAAASQLKAAREDAIIGRANRLPFISGSTSGSANRSANNNNINQSFGLTLSASWEADLWGRLRDLENAEYADYEVAIADFRAARLSLAVNIAQSWCNLITAEKQLILAQQTLDSYAKNFRIIERGYKAGILRPLDVNFARNNIANAERNLRSDELVRNEAARTLEELLGRYPEASLTTSADLPSLPDQVPAGIPMQLIERRPDLVARRALIYASAKRADSTRKSFLPDLNLTSSSGTSSSDLLRILDPGELAISIAANITQTLYSGGTLAARSRQSLADNQTQIELYTSDVLNALREVESALDASQALYDQEVFLKKEARQAILAEQFAEDELIGGTSTRSETQVLELLEAQLRADNARSSLISLRNQRLQNHLDLLLALGGTIE